MPPSESQYSLSHLRANLWHLHLGPHLGDNLGHFIWEPIRGTPIWGAHGVANLRRSFICGAPDLPADRVPKTGFQMGTPDWLPDGVPQINTKMGLTQIDSQMEVLQMGF